MAYLSLHIGQLAVPLLYSRASALPKAACLLPNLLPRTTMERVDWRTPHVRPSHCRCRLAAAFTGVCRIVLLSAALDGQVAAYPPKVPDCAHAGDIGPAADPCGASNRALPRHRA